MNILVIGSTVVTLQIIFFSPDARTTAQEKNVLQNEIVSAHSGETEALLGYASAREETRRVELSLLGLIVQRLTPPQEIMDASGEMAEETAKATAVAEEEVIIPEAREETREAQAEVDTEAEPEAETPSASSEEAGAEETAAAIAEEAEEKPEEKTAAPAEDAEADTPATAAAAVSTEERMSLVEMMIGQIKAFGVDIDIEDKAARLREWATGTQRAAREIWIKISKTWLYQSLRISQRFRGGRVDKNVSQRVHEASVQAVDKATDENGSLSPALLAQSMNQQRALLEPTLPALPANAATNTREEAIPPAPRRRLGIERKPQESNVPFEKREEAFDKLMKEMWVLNPHRRALVLDQFMRADQRDASIQAMRRAIARETLYQAISDRGYFWKGWEGEDQFRKLVREASHIVAHVGNAQAGWNQEVAQETFAKRVEELASFMESGRAEQPEAEGPETEKVESKTAEESVEQPAPVEKTGNGGLKLDENARKAYDLWLSILENSSVCKRDDRPVKALALTRELGSPAAIEEPDQKRPEFQAILETSGSNIGRVVNGIKALAGIGNTAPDAEPPKLEADPEEVGELNPVAQIWTELLQEAEAVKKNQVEAKSNQLAEKVGDPTELTEEELNERLQGLLRADKARRVAAAAAARQNG